MNQLIVHTFIDLLLDERAKMNKRKSAIQVFFGNEQNLTTSIWAYFEVIDVCVQYLLRFVNKYSLNLRKLSNVEIMMTSNFFPFFRDFFLVGLLVIWQNEPIQNGIYWEIHNHFKLFITHN